jgi:hypothetical protein
MEKNTPSYPPSLELSTVNAEEQALLEATANQVFIRVDELADRIATRYEQQSDAYGHLPAGELHNAIVTGVRAAVSTNIHLRGPGEDAAEFAALIGERRAKQGVPVEAVMETFHIAAQEVLEVWDQEAADLNLPLALILRVHDLSWVWANFAMTHAARAHRAADLQLARHSAERRSQFVRDLLSGRLTGAQLEQLCSAHRLSTKTKHTAFRASLDHGHEPAAVIEQAIVGVGGARPPLVANIDGDLSGIVLAAPALDTSYKLALGPPAELGEISVSFAIATEHLKAARAFGLGGVLQPDELGLLPAVLSSGNLGERLEAQYFAELGRIGSFGEELEQTVNTYLASERHIGATAHALDIHPNSVRHRLDRFQETTGLDLRETDSLVIAWWLLRRRAMAPISSQTAAETPRKPHG